MDSVIRNVVDGADVGDAVRANATSGVSGDTDLTAIHIHARVGEVGVIINHYTIDQLACDRHSYERIVITR